MGRIRKLAIICAATLGILGGSTAFAATLGNGTLTMAAGDSVAVSCPNALSVSNQSADALTLNCANSTSPPPPPPSGSIALVGTTTANTTSATTLTTALSSGTAAGDVIVSYVEIPAAVTATGPTGSTEVVDGSNGSGWSGTTLDAFVSTATAGQTSTSVDLSPANGGAMVTEVFSSATAYGATGTAASGLSSPSVTGAAGDELVLGEGSGDWAVAATAPSGSTLGATVNNGQGNQVAAAYVASASGATPAYKWGGTETAGSSLAGTVVLLPSGDAPPPPPLSVGTDALPQAVVGSSYSATLTPASGVAPYTWSATGLPAGLALSGATISGTPTAAGTDTVNVRVTDSSSPPQTATASLSLIVQSSTASCVTSAYNGVCPSSGSYTDANIVSNTANPGALTVSPNVWGPISGETATLYANGPTGWYTTFNVAKGNTSVTAYPNVGETYNEEPLSNFTSLTSSFDENQNPNANTDSWAAYDNWFNNWNNEVMIQTDFANGGNGPCGSTTGVYGVQFGGSNGVPVQDWQLCEYGSEIIWQLSSSTNDTQLMNEQSGSVDLLAMTQWLETHGYLPANSTITGLSFGWEICSTGGVPENYDLNNFTITGTT